MSSISALAPRSPYDRQNVLAVGAETPAVVVAQMMANDRYSVTAPRPVVAPLTTACMPTAPTSKGFQLGGVSRGTSRPPAARVKSLSDLHGSAVAHTLKRTGSVIAGTLAGATGVPCNVLKGYELDFYTAKETAAIQCALIDSALMADGIRTVAVGGTLEVGSFGLGSAVAVPAIAVGAAELAVGAVGSQIHGKALNDARRGRREYLEGANSDGPMGVSAGMEAQGSAWASSTKYGHAFTRHGQGKANTRSLMDRARTKNTPQGQWLNNDAGAAILAKLDVKAETVIEIPLGLGQVIMPNGSILRATHALIVPSATGIRTAYPFIP